MIINQASLAALRTNFSAIYQSAFDRAPIFYDKFCTKVMSSTGVNTYGFLDRIPKMRQWVGERQIQNLKEYAATLQNQTYELTIGVNRDDVEDDNLGIYNPLFSEMGLQAAKWPDQMTRTALQAGTTNLGFDGVAFFATNHPLNPAGNQSNLFATTPLTTANYNTVRQNMMSYTGFDGEPLGVMPNLLVVGPAQEYQARLILNADHISDATGGNAVQISNPLKGTASLLVVPEIANEDAWYLMDTTKGVNPFIYQERKAPLLTRQDRETDDSVFTQRQFMYGLEARGAIGYATWWLCARAKST